MAQLLEFMSGAEALVPGRFGLECDWGLLDISYHLEDDIIKNTPVVLTTFYGQQQYAIVTGRNKAVTTRPNDDVCGWSEAQYWIDECNFYTPVQQEVAIGIEKQRETALVEKLCRGKMFRGGASIFNTDGTIKAGTEIGEAFVRYQAAQLGEVNANRHEYLFWDGNPANQDEYQGIWDQLINGHTPVDPGQDCGIQAVQIDWNDLTGGSGTALPTDTITAPNDTFTVGPWTFSGMEGLNMVDVMLKWFRFVKNVLMRGKGTIQWEFWGQVDGVECVAEAAACTQPCGGADASDDPTVRGRVQEAIRTLTIRLYPHDDVPIPILQSPTMNLNNTMVFGPRSVGRDLLRAWTFRPGAETTRILESVFGDLPGRRMGSFDPTNFIPRETTGPMVDLEEQIFQSRHDQDQACIASWVTSNGVPLVFGQHLFLVFNNVICEPSIAPVGVNVYNGESVFDETITSCADGPGASELTIGFANAAGNFTCSEGDMITIEATDGTRYSGTITTITTVTPALIEVDLGFEEVSPGVPLDCTISGGVNGGTVTYAC